MSGHKYINKGVPQVDAIKKVTGSLEFISDIRMPGMLWGKVVRSPYPHARIKEIDITKALRVPGVKAVITAADINHIPCGPFIPDWEILAREKVRFVGQEVAAVAAIDPDLAEEAASLVKVVYEQLPAVFDMEEAMQDSAPVLYEERGNNIASVFQTDHGDVDKAFAESDYVREGVFYPSTAFHAYLEPNGCIAKYDPISSSYTLWAATQSPYKARLVYSTALGVELDKLRLIQVPFGGGFGGKFESNLHLVAACLSKKAQAPVRLVNTLEEEVATATLRVPMIVKTKLGINKDGRITAKETYIIADNGGRTNAAPAALAAACYRQDNLYRITNVRSRGYLVYTNNVPKGAMRGYGNPQGLFAVETLLDMLAEDAGIDPGDLRIINAYKNGEVTVHGWSIGSCGLPECISRAKEAAGWDKKRGAEKQSGPVKRGIGLACCNHVSGNRSMLKDFDGSTAMIKIGPDGKVIIFTGEVEIGQGYKTVATQCVAEVLSIPYELIEIAPVDSLSSVLGGGSLASRATVMGGNAVVRAAESVKAMILKAAAEFFGLSTDALDIDDGVFVNKESGEWLGSFKDVIRKLTNARSSRPFVATGYFTPNTVLPDPETNYGNLSPTYPFGAHIAEVEVDTETGKVEVVNYVAANDVGKAINPLLCSGQLEGGVHQGIGWALTEQIIVRDGEVVNRNLLDYKIPTFADMVNVKAIVVEEPDPNGPFGAKSLGEPAFNPVATAICNAIYDAVGVRINKLPVRPEELLSAIKARGGVQ